MDQLREWFHYASSFIIFHRDYQTTFIDALTCMSGNCTLLSPEAVQHFYRLSQNRTFTLLKNELLILCQTGATPALVFLLYTYFLGEKQDNGDWKTLDMIYKQACHVIFKLFPLLNPLPSTLRNVQSVSTVKVLILNRDETGMLWSLKVRFLNGFRAEVLVSEMDSPFSLAWLQLPGISDKGNRLFEECANVHEIYGSHDFQHSKTSALVMFEKLEITCCRSGGKFWQNEYSQLAKEEQLECLSLRDDLDLMMKSGAVQESEVQSKFEDSAKESILTDAISCLAAELSERPIASSKSSHHLDCNIKTTESCELQISVHRCARSRIILPRTFHSSNPSSYSNSLTRYRGGPSVLGITSLLHDYDEFSMKDECDSLLESSTASPPSDGHFMEQHLVDSKSVSKAPPPQSPQPPVRAPSAVSPPPWPRIPAPSIVPPPPPPPPPPHPPTVSSDVSIIQGPFFTVPTPITSLMEASSPTISQDSSLTRTIKSTSVPVAPPPPLPRGSGSVRVSTGQYPSLTPSNPPTSAFMSGPERPSQVVPPPPSPHSNGSSKTGSASLQQHSFASEALSPKRTLPLSVIMRTQAQCRKTPLKPYHWLKLTRASQGSIWSEPHKPEEASKVPELDLSELESLFSATVPNSTHGGPTAKANRCGTGLKPDKIHLVELRRAYNCEIVLTKVKVPLADMMNSVLALDDSALDIDQVDNLIKFCPTTEEMELLMNYNGDMENLGKCEQFFWELTKVPRSESKLRVFKFKIQFPSQLSDLRNSLNIVNSASEEVRNSVKLKRILQTTLSLGNALNRGTARGSAVGFRLDSLLKLTETRATDTKLTLVHYLCKVLAEKLPEVLDFHKDLVSLEAATKIQLKYLAEEMQFIRKGLEKVAQEQTASLNDGPVSNHFCKILKEFLDSAEVEMRSVASLYSEVGRNADALAIYFGEDSAGCPFEQVVSTLLNFKRVFERAYEENRQQLELEKKKLLKGEENRNANKNLMSGTRKHQDPSIVSESNLM